MKEVVIGRETCRLCAGDGKLPILGLDPVRHDGDLTCECAVQLMWDGRTFWVNGGDGGSIARFGPSGIDIHTTAMEQLEGKKACLHCVPAPDYDAVFGGKQGREHPLWSEFEAKLREHYGIVVPGDLG